MSGRDAEGRLLASRIRRWIRGSLRGSPPEPFGPLALDIHHYQAAHDPVVRALRENAPRSWMDIPAVPVDLYKDLSIGTVPEGRGRVFRTSGTTQGRRGIHRMWDTSLYDAGALPWAERCLGRWPETVHALLIDPRRHPDSSLSHMIALMARGPVHWYVGEHGLRVDDLNEALAREKEAVFLPATAFALAEWIEGDFCAPPRASLIMITGGFKGRRHRIEGDALYERVRALCPGVRLVTEYGMTELSSQLWGEPGTAFRPPPWLKVWAVDPFSGAGCPPEVAGQLRFLDLCNLDASIAVETLDEGIVHADGTLTLFGRLPGASARGCSLTIEERWDDETRAGGEASR